MQDRFKFRVWEKDLKKMKEVTQITLDEKQIGSMCDVKGKVTVHLAYQPQYIIMQSTGLKDKNGNLIYEGDIVEVQYIGSQIPLFKNEYSRQPEIERFEIFCHPEWLKFYARNDHYRKTCEIHSLDLESIRANTYNKTYEVIGNIYENKELLQCGS